MPTLKPWFKALAVLAASLGLGAGSLMIAGRRFAIESIYEQINSMAATDRERDKEMISYWSRELAIVANPLFRADIQSTLAQLESHSSSFVCFDQSTADLFSSAQQAKLEGSIKTYYGQVFWGQKNIPTQFINGDGSIKNGIVINYSLKVYPGIVKLGYSEWSGFLTARGYTKTYIWKGWGYRFHKQSEVWVS